MVRICCVGVGSWEGGSATSSQVLKPRQKPLFGLYVGCFGRTRITTWPCALIQGAVNLPAVSGSSSVGADGISLLETVAGNVSAKRKGGLAAKPAQL